MSYLYTFLALMMTSLTLWVGGIETYLMDRGYRTVQYGIEHAVHDAALQINIDSLADGFIDFNEIAAQAAIEESLKYNLDLDNSLVPNKSTFFTDKIQIHEVLYIDDNYKENITFPYILNYTMPDGQELEQVIFGPSVVLVVNAKIIGTEDYSSFLAIQEYKY